MLETVDALAAEALALFEPETSARQKIEVLNKVLFDDHGLRGTMDLQDLKSLSLRALLERNEGTCVTLVILYLAIAQRAGLRLHGASTPEHLFLRYSGEDGPLNVETLERGAFLGDSVYRSRHRMADESIRRGGFMVPLSKQEVLAHLVSNRGVLASRSGDQRAALHEIEAALLLHPRLAAAHYNRGLAHLALEDYEAARQDFTIAVEIHPLDAQAFNNRGIANQRLGDLDTARRDFEAALRIRPGLREAKENLTLLDSTPSGEGTPLRRVDPEP